MYLVAKFGYKYELMKYEIRSGYWSGNLRRRNHLVDIDVVGAYY
jgi:hypothetical protein